MNYFNSGDKVYTVGDIDRIERENFELKAQVDRLLEPAAEAAEALGFLSCHLRGRMGEAAIMDMAEKADALKDALKATPEQCFAEHYANVSQKAFIAGVNATGQGYNGEHGLSEDGIIELAEMYVARKIINQVSK